MASMDTYETGNTQLYAPLPPYLMHGPELNYDFPPSGVTVGDSTISDRNCLPREGAAGWPSEEAQNPIVPGRMPVYYNHIYGQGWTDEEHRPWQ